VTTCCVHTLALPASDADTEFVPPLAAFDLMGKRRDAEGAVSGRCASKPERHAAKLLVREYAASSRRRRRYHGGSTPEASPGMTIPAACGSTMDAC
jgi:hypothetical protein